MTGFLEEFYKFPLLKLPEGKCIVVLVQKTRMDCCDVNRFCKKGGVINANGWPMYIDQVGRKHTHKHINLTNQRYLT